MRSRWLFLAIWVLLFPVFAGARDLVITFPGIVTRMLADNPFTREARLRIRQAELELIRIRHRAFLPTLVLDIQSGIVPESDQTFIEGLGPFARFEVKAVQPIYTFGKITHARELAAFGVDIAKVQEVITRERLARRSAKAFWMLHSALRNEDLAVNLRKDYLKLLDEVETNSKKKDSDITAVDLLNVKTSRYGIESLYIKAKRNVVRVRDSLSVLLKLPSGVSPVTREQNLPLFSTNTMKPDAVLAYGLRHRPEMKALSLGHQAARAGLALARSMFLPDIFVAAGAKLRWAANRPSEDDFNDKGAGAFLGVTWKLGFWRTADDVKKAKLKIRDLQAKADMLRGKVTIEIRDAYSALVQEFTILEALRKSFKHSKTWHRLAGDNWEMGLGKVNEFIKAYTEYYKLKGALISQEMACANALIQLAHVMGNTKLVLRWFKDEKVTF